MKIALASDHAGYEQLKEVQDFLQELGYSCHNFGPKRYDPADDYPDFITPAAKAVADGDCDVGIIMGGSGQGEAMAANRIKGVRCAVFYGPAVAIAQNTDELGRSHNPLEIIKLSKKHNNANMLSLGARFVRTKEMKEVIKLWLDSPFSNEERHLRRIKKLDS